MSVRWWGGSNWPSQLPKHRLQLLRLECVSPCCPISLLPAIGNGAWKPGSGREQGPEVTAKASFPQLRHLGAPEDRLSCSEGTDKCSHIV